MEVSTGDVALPDRARAWSYGVGGAPKEKWTAMCGGSREGSGSIEELCNHLTESQREGLPVTEVYKSENHCQFTVNVVLVTLNHGVWQNSPLHTKSLRVHHKLLPFTIEQQTQSSLMGLPLTRDGMELCLCIPMSACFSDTGETQILIPCQC